MAATTTSGCTYMNFRCTSDEPEVRRATSHGSTSCGKLDRVATWVGSGLATAFFASLERCSCINIDTEEDGDGDGDEANDLPLISKDVSLGRDIGGGSRRRTVLKGKKRSEGIVVDYMDDK